MKIGFDRVYCISYCRNIEKQNNIHKVMKYLGINFEFIYGADYTNLEILKHKDFKFIDSWETFFKKCGNNFKYYTHFLGASYDHYTAVIHAYESGANSVLIMEDDCGFINDTSYIQWALNNYPKDADIIRFGYHTLNNLNKFKTGNFLKLTNIDEDIKYCGSQLYGICNRETIKEYINIQQNNFQCVDSIPISLLIKNKILYNLVYPLAIDDHIRLMNTNDNKNKYILLSNII